MFRRWHIARCPKKSNRWPNPQKLTTKGRSEGNPRGRNYITHPASKGSGDLALTIFKVSRALSCAARRAPRIFAMDFPILAMSACPGDTAVSFASNNSQPMSGIQLAVHIAQAIPECMGDCNLPILPKSVYPSDIVYFLAAVEAIIPVRQRVCVEGCTGLYFVLSASHEYRYADLVE